jgi:hypothetical protein
VYLIINTRASCFIVSGNHRKTTGLTSSSAFQFYTCISRTNVLVGPVRLPARVDTHSVAPSERGPGCIRKSVLSVITVTLQQPLNGGILLRSNIQLCHYCVPYFTGSFPDIKIMKHVDPLLGNGRKQQQRNGVLYAVRAISTCCNNRRLL